jgi:peptide/nickel transport system permease protein
MIRVGAAIVLISVLAALLAPWVVPYDPASQNLALRLERPSVEHPFGLDELGRDILSRVLAGARISLFVGLTVVGISTLVGVLLGAIAGYFGGWLDDLVTVPWMCCWRFRAFCSRSPSSRCSGRTSGTW